MQKEVLEHIEKRIKILFCEDFSGHDYFHTIRVYKNAMHIASMLPCNKEIVALAALLHDVDDSKLFTSKNNENARKIMFESKISQEMIEQVVKVINKVSFNGNGKNVPESIEGKIVQDADRLDAIGAIGIARAFAYGGSHKRKIYDPNELPNLEMNETLYRNKKGTTINHFYEKLLVIKKLMNTDVARNIAEVRTRYMEEYIVEFMKEWNGEL